MYVAAMEGDTSKAITALLDGGADAKRKNNEGKTAFDYLKENKILKTTAVYWRLNDSRYK